MQALDERNLAHVYGTGEVAEKPDFSNVVSRVTSTAEIRPTLADVLNVLSASLQLINSKQRTRQRS